MASKKTKYQVLFIVGTRPEIIKVFPVIRAFQRYRTRIAVTVLSTGQHRKLLSSLLKTFKITPRIQFNLMRYDQDLFSLTGKSLEEFHRVFSRLRPDLVLVQGDTTSALTGALAAYYHRLPIGHIEAGLRTYDKYNPFPEEMNRRLIDALADLHFAPTSENRANLLAENIPSGSIHVTGNTVIDAVRSVSTRPPRLGNRSLARIVGTGRPILLVTIHRREHFGPPLARILAAIRQIARNRPDTTIIFPVHPNPHICGPVRQSLLGRSNIHVVKPLDYYDFITLLKQARLVLTDSGGIQEEAAFLGTPVLVVRDRTERPEAMRAGTARLTGTQTAAVVRQVIRLLDQDSVQRAMSRAPNPFGTGQAAGKIVRIILDRYCLRRSRGT